MIANRQPVGRTVRSHLNLIGRFYEEFDRMEVTQKEVQEYLMKLGNKNTYRNNLSTLKVYISECLKRSDIMQNSSLQQRRYRSSRYRGARP
jgi:hypothetical protein